MRLPVTWKRKYYKKTLTFSVCSFCRFLFSFSFATNLSLVILSYHTPLFMSPFESVNDLISKWETQNTCKTDEFTSSPSCSLCLLLICKCHMKRKILSGMQTKAVIYMFMVNSAKLSFHVVVAKIHSISKMLWLVYCHYIFLLFWNMASSVVQTQKHTAHFYHLSSLRIQYLFISP